MNSNDQEKLAARLLELSADGAELDPNDIAALAAGDLDDTTRDAILARLARSDDHTVVAVIASARRPAVVPRRSGHLLWIGLAAAAAILVAVTLIARGGKPSVSDAQLVAAFDDLRAQDAALFEGIEPLLAEERRQAPAVERGGIVLHAPARVGLAGRPRLRWQAVAGATSYRVSALSDEGETLFTRESEETQLDWPGAALPVGASCVWTVETTVAGQRLKGSRAYAVADAPLRDRMRRGLAAIDARLEGPVWSLARAHFLIRLGLLEEAEAELAGPSNLTRETRAWLRARRGE